MARKKIHEGMSRDGYYYVLEMNRQYKAKDGCIYTPRSHLHSIDGVKCAIFDKLQITDTGFKLQHVILNESEFKKLMGLKINERITIR